jgi:hypothetical protein
MFKISDYEFTIGEFIVDRDARLVAVYANPAKPYEFFVSLRVGESMEHGRARVQKMLNYLNGFQFEE